LFTTATSTLSPVRWPYVSLIRRSRDIDHQQRERLGLDRVAAMIGQVTVERTAVQDAGQSVAIRLAWRSAVHCSAQPPDGKVDFGPVAVSFAHRFAQVFHLLKERLLDPLMSSSRVSSRCLLRMPRL
jgi:hypothetical protein